MSPKAPHRRLDSRLNDVVAGTTRPGTAPTPLGGVYPVAIHVRPGASLTAWVAASGGRLASVNGDTIEAEVPASALLGLATHPDVLRVESLIRPQPAVTSQGVAVHHADVVQASGMTGAGVKVGIIDVGFDGLTALMGSELPATITGRCYTGMGIFVSTLTSCAGDPHGTAVAETVLDVAPGVTLYVANPLTPADLYLTTLWMITQGVQVINHSAGWTWNSSAGDGVPVGPISPLASVELATANGIVWVNAAGNDAASTWTSAFVDADMDGFMEYPSGVEVNSLPLAAGSQAIIELRWADSWSAAARDLDLYLYNPDKTQAAHSTNVQDGSPGGIPYEVIVFTAPAAGTYRIAVHRYSGGEPPLVQVHLFGSGPLGFANATSSIGVPGDSASAGMLTVGAAAWNTTSTIEWYSSQGPTTDGRTKPDIVGADRADTVAYGPGNFPGTSQASPHVAGLAALVRQAYPSLTPAQVVAYLKGAALPRGTVPNNIWGTGFAWLPVMPTEIAFTAAPAVANTAVSFPVTVEVRDASHTRMTGDNTTQVTLSLVGAGSFACAANPVTVSAGVANTTCTVTAAGGASGVHLHAASNPAVTPADSAAFNVIGTPAKLGFTAAPTTGSTSAPLAPQPVVAVQDALGQTVTTGAPRAVTLTHPLGGGSVACTANPVNTASGVATFAGCQFNTAGAHQLGATTPGLTSATPVAVSVLSVLAPTNLAGSAVAGPGVHLTWTDASPSATVAFSVYRWKWGLGNPVELAGVVAASQLQFDDPGLMPSVLYYYWVVASDASGGAWSSAVQVVTLGGPPSAPSGLAAAATSQTAVHVTWNDTSNNELGFIIFRAPAAGGWELLEWLPAGTTTYNDTGRTANTFYFYWVWSWGWNGFSVSPAIALALTYP
ncbi:MAG: S8 family serine peptidase [Dehalococcoidia bacterium]|nr:S8 family serine peptidase [Dehalococcoidia bacterium]